MNDASFHSDFGPFDGRIWLNASHQGPLPRVAVEAGHRALELKAKPFNVSTSKPFNETPQRLREAVARLIGAPPEEVILGNSASYGMHLLALGLPLNDGDEVLLVEGDFPSTTFPWLLLRDRGVNVRFLRPAGAAVTPDELRSAITPQTRAFCTTWVHSFTGHALDLNEFGSICRERGVRFLVNGSQAVGARVIDVSRTPVDALVSCGFKWLCGPYGTGFCWIGPGVIQQMKPTQLYWLAHLTADELKGEFIAEPRPHEGERRWRAFDVFGTANFNNFMPWTASIEYLNEIGIERVASHDQMLAERLVEGLLSLGFEVLSRHAGRARSTIVIASHPDRDRNASLFDHLRSNGVDNSLRRGNLRFAPHIYNTPEQIDRTLELLREID